MARPPLPPADPRTTDDRAAKTWRRPPNPLAVRTRTDSHRGRKPESAAGTCRPPGLEPEQRLGRRAVHARRPARRRSRPALRKRACASTRRTTRGIARPVTPASQRALPAGRPTRFPRGCRSPARGRCTRGSFPDAITGSVTTTSMDCASRGAPVAPSRAPSSERPLSEPVRRPLRPRKTPAVCASKQRSRAVSIAS